MTRKDTILIAVVINAGLLAILFTTAVIYDTDKGLDRSEFMAKISDDKDLHDNHFHEHLAISSTGDEVDSVLQYYSDSTLVETPAEIHSETITVVPKEPKKEELKKTSEPAQKNFVEVKVKKGDVLEKIAKAHHTTIAAIKELNQLKNENLSVGQVLKIPLPQENLATPLGPTKVEEPKKEESKNEEVYYVIKKGDNPWKVSKQFGVNYEDILRLNHLDEEKARNLKIGDRIRVK